MCDQIVNAVPQVQGGTIKAYAIGTRSAIQSLPNVPTLEGRPACPTSRRRPGTRCSRRKARRSRSCDKLTAALDKALDDEATRKRLLDLGSDIPGKDRRARGAQARS